MYRKKDTSKQSSISSFFARPPAKKLPSDVADKENLFVEDKPIENIANVPVLQPTNTTRAPTSKPASWWRTPPKSDTFAAAGRKRSGESVAFPLAKRSNSGASWQGRVKPIVRPSGMASRGPSASQPSVIASALSDEQKNVLKMIVDHKQSVFFTGAAGTGKSYLLKEIIRSLRCGRYDSEIAVTATTGLAAYNIGGQTLHRWSGIRTGEGSVPQLVQNIRKNSNGVRDNWRRCKVLIIDEISMLDADVLDKLEEIGRLIRGSPTPFGGIQIVLTGDFFQLPPIGSREASKLCFEAKCWASICRECVVLTHIFRQKDNRLVSMLNAMRKGDLNPEAIQLLRSLNREVQYKDGLAPTQLYAVRWQVEKANASKMNELPGSVFTFEALDSSDWDSSKKLLDNLMCSKTLKLKIDAQVLLIRNLNDQLVNGRRGVVTTFMTDVEWTHLGTFLMAQPRAMLVYNSAINARQQQPSSENSGMDADTIVQAELDELSFPDLATRGALLEAIRSPIRHKLPVVNFHCGVPIVIERCDFTAGDERAGITRNQVPLVPSWALSIHKAQGQSLDRLVVDLANVFEVGQAYVAVSRATSYDTLQVRGFSVDKVRIHRRVADFYNKIEQSNNL